MNNAGDFLVVGLQILTMFITSKLCLGDTRECGVPLPRY